MSEQPLAPGGPGRQLSGEAPARPGPWSLPGREPLEGARVRLEPIDPVAHGQALFEAAGDGDPQGRLWDYMPYGPFANAGHFLALLEGFARGDDPLFFALCVKPADSGPPQPKGMASLMRMDPKNGVVEIGHIWLSRALQRRPAATEAVFLLMARALDTPEQGGLGYRRLEWKCNALNEASRRAALRYGFSFEGIFHQHMVVKGRNRDTAWFSLLDHEWPARRAAFETWLAPDNFDAEGRQKQSLSDLTRVA